MYGKTKMKDRTTIQLPRELIIEIKKLKRYKRETYEDILKRLMKDKIKKKVKKAEIKKMIKEEVKLK